MRRKPIKFLAALVLAIAISSCAFFSDGVVTSVESHYITAKREVLTISGTTATHPIYGIFMVDNPPLDGKPYRNDDNNATLTFTTDGTRQQAMIEFDDMSPKAVFDMHMFGGPRKATVLGIFW